MKYNIRCPLKGTPALKKISNEEKEDTNKSKNLITST